MKLLRYGAVGRERPGLLDDRGRVRDLTGVVPDIAGDSLLPEGLATIADHPAEALPVVDGQPRLGPCVGQVGKMVCIGLNYSDHAEEAGMEPPAEPILFMKATSAICGPNDDVRLPPGSQKADWEVELGVVIGKPARYVTPVQAFDHVAGYCIVNDLSERDYQMNRGGQWVKGKSCDTFGPIGPWLVTADEVPDPQSLRLWLEVDGVRRQNGTTSKMIFGVAELVSYVSQFMSLQPGDLISTGTPPGVGLGLKPPRYLTVGNEIRLGIDGLGEQRQRVVAEPGQSSGEFTA